MGLVLRVLVLVTRVGGWTGPVCTVQLPTWTLNERYDRQLLLGDKAAT